MLSPRRFKRLDRDRLDRFTLRLAGRDLAVALEALRSSHAVYASEGKVPALGRSCQGLVDVLDGAFELPGKRVIVRDRPRPHRRRNGRIVSELHGLCESDGPIELYSRTAARARPVALLTLLNTLVHEWVHHYDFSRFGASVHSAGFYERLGQVYRPSRDWLKRRQGAGGASARS